LVILVISAFSRELAVAKENCTRGDTKKLAAALQSGRSLRAVVTELDSAGAHYMVFSGDQKISPDVTERKGVNSLLPISILVTSRDAASDSGWWSQTRLVREDEVLTLAFDGNRILVDWSCELIFTGP
jgi:hypothetical protein